MMLAILIDPFTETIEMVDYSGDWEDISALIGCSLFTTINLGDSDTLCVDDEGLYVKNQRFFNLKGYPQPLAGRGLVLGYTLDGDSTDSSLTVSQVQDMVSWCPEGLTVEPGFEVYGFNEPEDILEALGIDPKTFTGTVSRGRGDRNG